MHVDVGKLKRGTSLMARKMSPGNISCHGGCSSANEPIMLGKTPERHVQTCQSCHGNPVTHLVHIRSLWFAHFRLCKCVDL